MSQKTGGSNDYYSLDVTRTLDGRDGYTVQCLEVIEALGMTFAEGEAFKAIWRSCAARTLGKHKADNHALYDAEKVEFYGKRMVVAATPAKVLDVPEFKAPSWATHTLESMGVTWYVRAGKDFGWEALDYEGTQVVALFNEQNTVAGSLRPVQTEPFRDCPVGDAPTVFMDVEMPDGKASVRPEHQWGVGTRLRWIDKTSEFYIHGQEYEVLSATLDGWMQISDQEEESHPWTLDEARKHFVRA